MRYQIVMISRNGVTALYVEPSTFYPSREAAEEQIPRLEQEAPNLKGQLEVVPSE